MPELDGYSTSASSREWDESSTLRISSACLSLVSSLLKRFSHTGAAASAGTLGKPSQQRYGFFQRG
jgi:hypothetical protein